MESEHNIYYTAEIIESLRAEREKLISEIDELKKKLKERERAFLKARANTKYLESTVLEIIQMCDLPRDQDVYDFASAALGKGVPRR
jgi:hypothetical protein